MASVRDFLPYRDFELETSVTLEEAAENLATDSFVSPPRWLVDANGAPNGALAFEIDDRADKFHGAILLASCLLSPIPEGSMARSRVVVRMRLRASAWAVIVFFIGACAALFFNAIALGKGAPWPLIPASILPVLFMSLSFVPEARKAEAFLRASFPAPLLYGPYRSSERHDA